LINLKLWTYEGRSKSRYSLFEKSYFSRAEDSRPKIPDAKLLQYVFHNLNNDLQNSKHFLSMQTIFSKIRKYFHVAWRKDEKLQRFSNPIYRQGDIGTQLKKGQLYCNSWSTRQKCCNKTREVRAQINCAPVSPLKLEHTWTVLQLCSNKMSVIALKGIVLFIIVFYIHSIHWYGQLLRIFWYQTFLASIP